MISSYPIGATEGGGVTESGVKALTLAESESSSIRRRLPEK